MRQRSKSKVTSPWAGIPELPPPASYSTGDAADILSIPMWRLQKFLSSPAYRLSAFDQLGGKGKGSRRMFSMESLYRLGTAIRLVQDGFTPKFVGSALKHLDQGDFREIDEQGRYVYPGILFRRTPKGPQVDFFASGNPPEIKPEGWAVYYALDLRSVIEWVNKRIQENEARTKSIN